MTTNSSERGGRPGIRNVPPPAGGASPTPAPYARFIPREEVHSFAAWNPDSFGGPQAAAEAEPPPPTPEQQRAAQQAARQTGYQDGYRDGLAALEAFKQSFARQTAQQLGQLVAAFDAQFEGLEARMAQALAQAATQLARQVVRCELKTQPELIAAVANEAVECLTLSARHVTVLVHPDDLPLVAEGAGDELDRRGARLVASTQVARGGCLVESDVGAVDAGIEARWQRASSALGDDTPLAAGDSGADPLVLRGEGLA